MTIREIHEWVGGFGEALAGAFIGLVTWVLNLRSRVEKLEILNLEVYKDIPQRVDTLERQVVNIDSLHNEIKQLTPDVKEMVKIGNQMGAILDGQNRRLVILEDVLIGTLTRHQ